MSLQAKRFATSSRRFATLVLAFRCGAHPRLLTVLACQHAETDRGSARHREVLHGPRGFLADQIVVAGLAADDAAERHIAVEAVAGGIPLARLHGDRDGHRNLEGA